MINNKQSNLLLKNWLRLHSDSGPSLKNQLLLHSYFRKSLRLRPESTPTLRLLYTARAHSDTYCSRLFLISNPQNFCVTSLLNVKNDEFPQLANFAFQYGNTGLAKYIYCRLRMLQPTLF